MKLSDIAPGTILRGTVRNITDFGAFIDIGLHQDGLIHISELANRRVNHPLDVLSIGDTMDVMVISIDEKRGRIGLSLKRVKSGNLPDPADVPRRGGSGGDRRNRNAHGNQNQKRRARQ